MMLEANTKLSEAIIYEDFEGVKQWLPKAKVYADASDGLTPLHRFYSCESYEIMEFALKNHVNPNSPLMDMSCQTLIYGAIRNVQPEIVRLLVNEGAKINWVDANGDTPLSFAVKNEDRFELVTLLIKLDADATFGNNVFSLLEKEPQNLSGFHDSLKEALEDLLFEKEFDLLKRQIKRLRSLEKVPEDLLEEFKAFEALAELQKEDDSETKESTSKEENDINTDNKNKYHEVQMMQKERRLSDEETTDTCPSLNKVHSTEENLNSGGNMGKDEEKNYHNKNAKLRSICEQDKEEGSIYLSGF